MLILLEYVAYSLLSFLIGWWAHSGYYVWRRSDPNTWAHRSPGWGCGAILIAIPIVLLGRHLGQTGSRELAATVGFGSAILGFAINSPPIRTLMSGGILKTRRYRNKQWSFEITLPPGWSEVTFAHYLKSFPQIPNVDQLANPEFSGPNGSSVKFAIGSIFPIPSVGQQKMNLQRIAEKHGHHVSSTGEIEVNGKRHATMICEIPFVGEVKNYSLLYNNTEYFVTASGNVADCDTIVQSFTMLDSQNKVKQSFQLFCKAKKIFELYVREHAVNLDNYAPSKRQEAREDRSLAEAERLYVEALSLSEEKKKWRNVATTWHQLGMLYYLQGKPEAKDACCKAIAIIENLPEVWDEEKAAASSCHHFLGMIALEQKEIVTARSEFQKALEIDIAIHDLRGASVERQALKRCDHDEQ